MIALKSLQIQEYLVVMGDDIVDFCAKEYDSLQIMLKFAFAFWADECPGSRRHTYLPVSLRMR